MINYIRWLAQNHPVFYALGISVVLMSVIWVLAMIMINIPTAITLTVLVLAIVGYLIYTIFKYRKSNDND
jgi:archaellum biogenesis protein FlaJ (TadC family)